MGTKTHKKRAPKQVTVAIITLSSTRSLAEDKSGQWIARQVLKEGHRVVSHQVFPDVTESIRSAVLEVIREQTPGVILLTGGTGISPKDVTIEALSPLFDKELTSFGALFAQLSYEQVDSAALLSRATAGIIGKTIVFCMPGSLNACKLACKALILPELGHMVGHIYEG